MDELKPILDRTRVPDPGPAYWDAFPDRVKKALEAGPPSARPLLPGALLRGAAAAAACAAFAVLLALSAGRDVPPPGPAPSAPTVVAESKRTARLAGESEAEGVLLILQRAAREKAEGAQSALVSGNWETVASMARAYEKIVRGGLLPSLRKALEEDEDLLPFVPSLRESLTCGATRWREMADRADDPASRTAAVSALEASDAIIEILDDRFGPERG